MREILIRFSTGRNISILFVLFLAFNIWILPSMMPGEKPLDLEIYYSAEEAYQRIDSFPQEIRESYKMGLMVWDMLYPLVYSLLFSFVIFSLWQNEKLAILPFLILFFDVVENISIVNILQAYPLKSAFWGPLAGKATAIKWFFSSVTLLAVLAGIGKKMTSRNTNP